MSTDTSASLAHSFRNLLGHAMKGRIAISVLFSLTFLTPGMPSACAAGEEGKGAWAWYLAATRGGDHRLELMLPYSVTWKGSMSAWMLSTQHVNGIDIVCTAAKTVKPAPMPPKPWAPGEVPGRYRLGRVQKAIE